MIGSCLRSVGAAVLLFAASMANAAQVAPLCLDVPRCSVAPLVTADPADPAWRDAGKIDGLPLMRGPQATGLTPSPTRVELLWDANHLYVRFLCDDSDVVAAASGRPVFDGDAVEVFIDPAGDGREFVELQVNPDGVSAQIIHLITAPVVASDSDGVLLPQIMQRDDWSFAQAVLPGFQTTARRVPVAVDGPGWIADLSLPAQPLLRRVGAARFEPMTIRANFVRFDVTRRESAASSEVAMAWSPVVWGRPHRSPQAMGSLRLTGK